ncbi:uncharacterized protein LOC107772743 isoform X1 [Nicotiana tabacum]|uniref:Uncharacterized protein LOC107772743 isoform X1 n=1 Tax=Nicotiana tabacum TaxID=4097 RepID=A0A1S3Y6H2_TOBAC|nr:PREDICTED: uncharacterized protein LOC107772743 [Nicotiana tabacum]
MPHLRDIWVYWFVIVICAHCVYTHGKTLKNISYNTCGKLLRFVHSGNKPVSILMQLPNKTLSPHARINSLVMICGSPRLFKDKFVTDDINDQRDHVLKHMRKLWNNWRGSMHKNIKSKPFRYAIKDVPKGVGKSDWEWLVKEHFFTEKFKDKIKELVQSESSLTIIEVVERCFEPQRKSHVVRFGDGITAKELKSGNSSKAALLEKLNATVKETESRKGHLEGLESKYDELGSKYAQLAKIVFDQLSSPSSSDQ